MKNTICNICGKEFYHFPSNKRKFCSTKCGYINLSRVLTGRKFTKEHRRKMSENAKLRSGSKSSNWRGGRTLENDLRLNRWYWRKLRMKIIKRDKFMCQKCRKRKKILNVHHMIPYIISKNDSEDNLITLCQSCHMKIENKYLIKYKMQKIDELIGEKK